MSIRHPLNTVHRGQPEKLFLRCVTHRPAGGPIMFDVNRETSVERFGVKVDRARFDRFHIMIADHNHQGLRPLPPQRFEEFTQGRVGRGVLFPRFRRVGPPQVSHRINLVELNHRKIGSIEFNRCRSLNNRLIGSVSEQAPSTRVGQLTLRRPVDIGLKGAANVNQILISE